MGREQQHRSHERAAERARLDAVFGTVLPETSADERDERESGATRSEAEYLRDRPPHHER